MLTHAFADFLEQLQAQGRLIRGVDAVCADVEAAAKATEAASQALLMSHVTDRDYPLVAGIFSLPESISAAFDSSSLDEPAARLTELLAGGQAAHWLDRLGGEPSGALTKYRPRTVRSGPVQQIVRLGGDVDLGRLPIPTFHAQELLPVITAGRLATKPPDEDRAHGGLYDFRVAGPDQLVACWAPSSEPARLLGEYRRRGEPMPVAVVLGGDPADLLLAAAPLPADINLFELAGFIKQKARELVPARQIDLPVPADAEFVLEGTIAPDGALIDAGGGLDTMGVFRPLRPGPVVQVEAITHRSSPVFPMLLPQELAEIRRALVPLALPFLCRELAGLVDLSLPDFGNGRRWAFASIRQSYTGQARQFAHAFWALPQLLGVRYLVVVDEPVDVHNPSEVWAAVATHAAPSTDVVLGDAPPDQFIDDESPGRMFFDALRGLG